VTVRLAVALVAAALAPTLARSATVCVDPSSPTCQPTIQAGVNAAAPGDVVMVAPGLYREAVVIPETKAGLELAGSGRHSSIVDPGPTVFNYAIQAQAPGVEVRDFGIRGAYGGVGLLGSDSVVRGMRILGAVGAGGIGINGPRGQALGNEILGSEAGIGVFDAPDSVVAGNRIVQVGIGISADRSPRTELRDNVVTMASRAGLRIFGDDMRLLRNTVIDVNEFGLDVFGRNPVVEDNRVRHTGQNRVTCQPCSGGAVRGNVSHSSLGRFNLDGIAWHIKGDDAGFTVEDNLASRPTSYGFVLTGRLMQVAGNVVIEGRSSGSRAFLVQGRRHSLTENAAVRGAGAGFELQDDDHVLEANTASGTRSSGFLAAGVTTAILRRNVAAGSTAAGFAVLPEAVGTRVERNRGVGNRYDLCDDGVDTVVLANNFQTVSSVCDLR
jgi:nitrous oxidase accessory protein NosD